MYFDIQYYRRVLRHVWFLKQWPGRNKMLFKLLMLVPLEYCFHASCFLLDYILFPSLWSQKVERPVFMVGHARSGNKIHLSKSPVMSGWVEAIIEAFPDARIGVMIRKPLEYMPSGLKLVEVNWKGKGWTREDYEEYQWPRAQQGEQ